MPKVELFFDHTCPYCLEGHEFLMELLPKHPDIEIVWKPVEAHPKIEEPEHLPYEDLAVQGAIFVQNAGGDELKYHENVYHAYFTEKKAPDDITVLAECAKDAGVDTGAFTEALESRKYEKALQEANDYAYERKKVWAVPTYVFNNTNNDREIRLDSVPGVGVTKTQLDEFLTSVSEET